MSTGSKPPHILSVDPLPAGKPGARTADRRSVILNANDGSAVVVNDDGTVRMNVPAWGQSRVLDISPDDQWAACQGKSYEVRRIKDGQRVCTIGSRDTAQLRFSPDGKYLAISTRVATFVYGTDVWKELARWPVALTSEKVGHTDFSPDGKLLAGCAEPGVITLRETRRWTPLIQLQTPGSPSQRSGTFRMAWTPDGSRLIVLSVAQRVIDWDIQRLRAELAKLHLDWE